MTLSGDDLRRLGAPLHLARDGSEARRRKTPVRQCFAGNPRVAADRRLEVLLELEARDLASGEGERVRSLGERVNHDAEARAEWLALVYRRASRVRRLMIQAARAEVTGEVKSAE
jgi:hypothetical protein